jgi:hypothetical protein
MIRSRRVSEAHANYHALGNKKLPVTVKPGGTVFLQEHQMKAIREFEAARDTLDTCRSRPRCARYFIMGRAPGFRYERRRVTWTTVRNLVKRGYCSH